MPSGRWARKRTRARFGVAVGEWEDSAGLKAEETTARPGFARQGSGPELNRGESGARNRDGAGARRVGESGIRHGVAYATFPVPEVGAWREYGDPPAAWRPPPDPESVPGEISRLRFGTAGPDPRVSREAPPANATEGAAKSRLAESGVILAPIAASCGHRELPTTRGMLGWESSSGSQAAYARASGTAMGRF
jgi:hypothetical protein